MGKRFGIRDIAEITGYSVATVSRVLNQTGKYSEEAEKAILEVARKHQYHPDIQAKGLKNFKSHYVGILIPDLNVHFYASLARMIQKDLIEQNYYPIFLDVGPQGLSLDKGIEILLSLNAAGIICISSQIDNMYLDQLDVPVVYVNRFFSEMDKLQTNVKRSSVSMDYRQGSALAAKELADKGCKKVTFITTERHGMSDQANRLKKETFQEMVPILGMEYVDCPAEHTDQSISAASYEQIKAFHASNPDIDGFYCGSDYAAVGVLTYLLEQGIDVPGTVQIISFGQTYSLEVAVKAFSAIALPEKHLSREASRLIIDLVEQEDVPFKEVLVPVSFAKGRTTKP